MVYMKHPASGGAAYFPDEDGVQEWHEARGWEQADEPEAVPYVPPAGDEAPAEDEWVELVHPESGGTHQFPNTPEALEGAYDAGWQHPEGEAELEATPAGNASRDEWAAYALEHGKSEDDLEGLGRNEIRDLYSEEESDEGVNGG